MKSKFLPILTAMLLAVGALAVHGCYYSGPRYVGPPAGTVVLGDYDDGHVWHDRYWWVAHRHPWVHEHHPEWLEEESHEEHEAYLHRHP